MLRFFPTAPPAHPSLPIASSGGSGAAPPRRRVLAGLSSRTARPRSFASAGTTRSAAHQRLFRGATSSAWTEPWPRGPALAPLPSAHTHGVSPSFRRASQLALPASNALPRRRVWRLKREEVLSERGTRRGPSVPARCTVAWASCTMPSSFIIRLRSTCAPQHSCMATSIVGTRHISTGVGCGPFSAAPHPADATHQSAGPVVRRGGHSEAP